MSFPNSSQGEDAPALSHRVSLRFHSLQGRGDGLVQLRRAQQGEGLQHGLALHSIELAGKLYGIVAVTDRFTPYTGQDTRLLIQPKQAKKTDYPFRLKTPDYQVFEDKFGFTPNLSVIDLLFNEGPQAVNYLRQLQQLQLLRGDVVRHPE